MKINTNIKANPKFIGILGSVIGQMSDGIWENTRSMEKYWKSLSYEVNSAGDIVIIDHYFVCSDPVAFFANKIKQVIKVEIEDHGDLEWERSCSKISRYLNHTPVSVGDAYMLYELLKGRDISKHSYASLQTYTVTFDIGGTTFDIDVAATSPYSAKSKAQEKFLKLAKTTAVLK